ncbi:hypothetical protein MBLNU13_g00640t3 [Cladosporium sp. NU13]
MDHLDSLALVLAAPTDPENLTSKKAVLPKMQTGTTTISSFSPQNLYMPSQTSDRRRPSLSVPIEARHSAGQLPAKAGPGLSRLPSLRHKRPDSTDDKNPLDTSSTSGDDLEDPSRESAREAGRRQRALDVAIVRHQEILEAAENLSLYRASERPRYRRSFDPLHRLPDSYLPSHSLDNERTPWSRHTSPPAHPRHGRPVPTRTRFASSSPLTENTRHVHRSYGHASVHQYHYPDASAASSRRPSDRIRERGREVIEREPKAAMENLPSKQVTTSGEEEMVSPGGQPSKSGSNEIEEGTGVHEHEYDLPAEGRESAVVDDTRPNKARWDPVFDEVDERISELEYYDISEGSARQEIRRRRERDDSGRRERRDEFFR